MPRIASILALVCALGPVAPARAATHFVTLKSGRFNEPNIQIAVGDTVQWTALESGHTVSASDYRFDYWPNRTLTVGESVPWTFTEDETFRYICRIHAPGMSGVITVGEGSPPPPPPPPITGESRRVPSAEYPTVDAALAGLEPDSEIILEPGTYPPFTVDVADVLVRGAQPGEVEVSGPAIVDGGNLAKTGIAIAADDVTIRDLEVRRVAERAILVGADDASIEYAVLQTGFFEGIAANGVSRLRIAGVSIASSPGATAVSSDDPNTVLIEDTTITGAKTGIRVRGGNGVVIRNSTIAGSGTGIALRGGPGDPLVGGHIFGNEITATQNPIGPPDQELDLVTGAGVWLDGTWSVTVEANLIDDVLTYGVAITGLGGPTLDARSVGNVTTDAFIADEGWDGIGSACSTATRTEPPTLGVTNSCGSPGPGVPYPKVALDLIVHATVGSALREL